MKKTLQQLSFELGAFAAKRDHRVMIVEDLTEAQQHLRRSLRKVGFNRIDLFTSAEEAKKALRSIAYDIIFCDMNLLGMSGGTFLHRSRTDGLLAPHSLFFMVSGEVQIDSIRKLLTQAPDEYIAKPYTEELLWRKLLKNMKLREDRLNKVAYLERGADPIAILNATMPKTQNVVMRSISYRNLASALESLGRNKEALDIYSLAEDLFENNRAPRWLPIGKGRTYERMGLFNKAIDVYLELLNSHSQDAVVNDALSRCYEGLGKFDMALEQAWITMTLTVSNREAIERVVRLSELTNQLEYMEEALYRSIRLDRRMNIDVVELVSRYLMNVYALLELGELTEVVSARFTTMINETRKMKRLPPAALSNTYRAELFYYISNGKLNQAISVKRRWDEQISRNKAKAPTPAQSTTLQKKLDMLEAEMRGATRSFA